MKIYINAARYGKGRLNPNIEQRDEILFGNYDPSAYSGGIRRFRGLDSAKLETLITEGFVYVGERQNDGPSIDELLDFNEDWNDMYTFQGYATNSSREDYRITIDSIQRKEPFTSSDEDEVDDFNYFTEAADEIDDIEGYAWWD